MKDPKLKKLTLKEDKFACHVIAGDEYIDAYNKTYKGADTGKHANRVKDAFMVSTRPHVEARIAKGRAELAADAKVTAESLVVELEEARQIAKADIQAAAMVSATMGKAKLYGLDKVVVEIRDAGKLTPWSAITAGIDTKDGS